MAGKNSQDLYSQIEQTQAELRESIEHSRELAKASEKLIRQFKASTSDARGGARPGASNAATQAGA